MRRKNGLEILIKSLNKGELRQFTLHSNIYSSKKVYLKIFKKIQRGELIDNNLSQQKMYLYNSILESLVGKIKINTPESKIFYHINCADFLFRKQIPTQAYSHIKKALKVSKKYELFGYHIQLIEKEKQIRLYLDTKKERSSFEINIEEILLIKLQQKLQEKRKIYNFILDYKKKYGYLDKLSFSELNKKVNESESLAEGGGNLSIRINYYHHFSKSILFWMQKKHESAFKHTKLLSKLNKNVLSPSEYLNGILEHTTSCICLGKFKEVLQLLKHVRYEYNLGTFGNYNNIILKIFYYCSNYETMSYVFLGEQDSLKQKIIEINKGIKCWEGKIPLEMKFVLASVLKLAYIALGELDKAKKEIFFILNEKNTTIRIDAYEDSLMSNLIIIFEQGDVSYLESFSFKTITYFKSHKNKGAKHVKINRNISKAFYDYSIYKLTKKEFLFLYQKLIEKEMIKVTFSELYYPYLIWVYAQINNTTYIKTAEKMYKNKLLYID